MKVRLTSLNRRCQSVLRACRRASDAQKVPAYLVGGLVRDLMLNRSNQDLDFVIEGDAPAVARRMARDLQGRVTVYPRFLTATVILSDEMSIDLATTRQERYPCLGMLPEVRPGDIHDDLLRRDFTINAMAVSVNRGSYGQLVDIYNGQADLQKRRIRILHENSFHEDPTRIFRAIRFEQRFGFALERATARCLRSALKKDVMRLISADRYFNELKKILHERHPVRALRRLSRLGLLSLRGLDRRVDYRHMQRFENRVNALRDRSLFQNVDLAWVYFLAFCEQKNMTEINRLAQSFPLTRHQLQCLRQTRMSQETADRLSKRALTPAEVVESLRGLPFEVIAFWRARYPSQRLAQRIDRYFDRDRQIRPDLNGSDLKKKAHVSGKAIGKLLSELTKRKINGTVCNRREEWIAVREILARGTTGCGVL